MTKERDPVIQTHNLTKTYGQIEALKGLDLQVPENSISLRGDIDAALTRLSSLPWVSGVDVMHRNEIVTLQASVTDKLAAETQLARRVPADEQVLVTAFQRKRYELGEILLSVVEGDNHGRR